MGADSPESDAGRYSAHVRCPACIDADLDKEGNCRRCGGQWVDEQLVEHQAAHALRITGGRYSERHCPMCDEKMDEPLIFDVPIDRCEAHGMWFDKAELEKVLQRARTEGWEPERTDSPGSSLTGLIAAVNVWRGD